MIWGSLGWFGVIRWTEPGVKVESRVQKSIVNLDNQIITLKLHLSG